VVSKEELLAGKEPFDNHIKLEVADVLIKLARSDDDEDINDLIRIGMTRGLRHPRIAFDAIDAQLGQRFAKKIR